MTHRMTELPVYLYIENVKKGKYDYFIGDLYSGRHPRKEEVRMYKKDNNREMESFHSLESLTNPVYDPNMIVNCRNDDKGLAFQHSNL